MCRTFVAYYRASDDDDLEEQVVCVIRHLRATGGRLTRSYRDDETTGPAQRTELKKALRYARRHDATLIIATLKGLSRDVRILRALQESGVEFVACDLPHANSSTIHVLIAIAEYEIGLASARSQWALAAYKERGGKPGAARLEGRDLDDGARSGGAQKAARSLKARADEAYRHLSPLIKQLRDAGWTLQEIADRLNAQGHLTRRGRPWRATQVARVLDRRLP